MSSSTTWRWIGLAILGLLVAAAVAFAASRLASRQIGLASEPLSAGDALAPVSARPHGTNAVRHRRSRGESPAAERQGGAEVFEPAPSEPVKPESSEPAPSEPPAQSAPTVEPSGSPAPREGAHQGEGGDGGGGGGRSGSGGGSGGGGRDD